MVLNYDPAFSRKRPDRCSHHWRVAESILVKTIMSELTKE